MDVIKWCQPTVDPLGGHRVEFHPLNPLLADILIPFQKLVESNQLLVTMPSQSASASAKRKQDEKHYNILKELLAQDCNKKCFDCGQRGPVYVNMTIGAFVCTSCSGLLRGLSSPHRVKSVSMASFTPEEMDFIQKHGNDACYCVWMGRYEQKYGVEAFPESKDELKLRDFLHKKYEQKLWYVSEAKAMEEYEQARKKREVVTLKEAASKAPSASKPSIPVPASSRDSRSGNKVMLDAARQAQANKAPSGGSRASQSSTMVSNQNQLDMIFGSQSEKPMENKPQQQQKEVESRNASSSSQVAVTSNDPFASNAGDTNKNGFDLFANFPSTNQSQPSIVPATLPAGFSSFVEPTVSNATSGFAADFSQMSLNNQPVMSVTAPSASQANVQAKPNTSVPTAVVNPTPKNEDKYAVLASLDEELKSGSSKTPWSNDITSSNSPRGGGVFYNMSQPNSNPISSGLSNSGSFSSGMFVSGGASGMHLPPQQGNMIPTQQNVNTNPIAHVNPFNTGSSVAQAGNPFADPNWSQFSQGQTSVSAAPNQFTTPVPGGFAPMSPNQQFGAFGVSGQNTGFNAQSQHFSQNMVNYQNQTFAQQPSFNAFAAGNSAHMTSNAQPFSPFNMNSQMSANPMLAQQQIQNATNFTPYANSITSNGFTSQQNQWPSPVPVSNQNMQSSFAVGGGGGGGIGPFAAMTQPSKSHQSATVGAAFPQMQWPNQQQNTASANMKANPFL